MRQSCSITLYLDGNGENWSWHITVTVNNRREPSVTIPLTQKVLPTDLHKKFFDNIDLIDHIRARNIGIDLFKSIFPSEIGEVLKNAANTDSGDIYFKIPPEWADIPFDLCYLPQRGFLGQLFRIGTTIRVETVNPRGKEKPTKNKILIITDSTEKARQEAGELKRKAKENNWDVHVISEGNTSKILQEIERASVVHYAGHSPDTGNGHSNGWRLASGRVFDISDMEKLMTYNTVPRLVFSNSCHAGNYSNDSSLSGIAGMFLKVGVLQVIGPVWEVNDDEAKEFALLFYKYFFKGSSSSESLLAAKQEMSEKNTTPLIYRLYGDPLHSYSLMPSDDKITPSKLKILLGIISIIIVCLLIRIIIPLTTITLGIVDYSSHSDKTILEKELEEKCKTAQGNLPFYERYFKYKFKGKVIPGEYSNILSELKERKIDIAFVPPYCYLYHKYRPNNLEPNKLGELELVGVKTKWNNISYTSGFLVHKDSGIHSLSDINENTVKSFIHGDSLSTSTFIIPFLFLLERGLTKIVRVNELKRRKMIPKIKNSKEDERLIGSLSNEDWERIRDQWNDFLRYIPIDNMPIPYDAVLVHKPSWAKRFDVKEHAIILKALSGCIRKVQGSWEEQYPTFVDYVASGIITKKFLGKIQQKDYQGEECYIVFLPMAGLDLYRLNKSVSDEKPIMVDIFRFKGEPPAAAPKYRMEKIKIGSGKLMKIYDTDYPNAVLLFNLNTKSEIDNLLGLHVLARN